MADELTRPHDYRVLLEACPALTIVGGQAVIIWAIAYLEAEPTVPEGFGSHDIDVVAQMQVAEIIAALPDWKSEKPPMWSFDRRLLRLTSRAHDGRLLIVEVLGKVNGLEQEDLKAVTEVEQDGISYRVLDPIAMLRAKAANVGKSIRSDRHPVRIGLICNSSPDAWPLFCGTSTSRRRAILRCMRSSPTLYPGHSRPCRIGAY